MADIKPYYSRDGITIYHADCREVLPGIESDAIVTDPPYGSGWPPRGGEKPGSLDFKTGAHPEWDVFTTDWVYTCRDGIPAAVFCNIKSLPAVMKSLKTNQVLFYIKSNPNPVGCSIEACVTRGFSAKCPQHITAYNAFNGQQHPTQKPLSVMRWIIQRVEAETVLDPFMGSGTTLRAAKDLGRQAIGIEIEERYCEIAAKRLEQQVLPFSEDPPPYDSTAVFKQAELYPHTVFPSAKIIPSEPNE